MCNYDGKDPIPCCLGSSVQPRWGRVRHQYLQDIKLGCLDFGPRFLQPCHWTEVHASWRDMGRGQAMEKQVTWGAPPVPGHSHMMAIMELKFPMLKHSRATSMKNSSMRVRCFFFTTWKQWVCLSVEPPRGHWAKIAGRALDSAARSLGMHLPGDIYMYVYVCVYIHIDIY